MPFRARPQSVLTWPEGSALTPTSPIPLVLTSVALFMSLFQLRACLLSIYRQPITPIMSWMHLPTRMLSLTAGQHTAVLYVLTTVISTPKHTHVLNL